MLIVICQKKTLHSIVWPEGTIKNGCKKQKRKTQKHYFFLQSIAVVKAMPVGAQLIGCSDFLTLFLFPRQYVKYAIYRYLSIINRKTL